MRKLVKEKGLESEYEIDSAGLIRYHEGEGADSRMKFHAKRHGYLLTHISRPVREIDFDLFVNNAGFGDIGRITKTDIRKEIDMVKLNDIATLILVKEFLKRFIAKDKGRVLTVASAAAFAVAPYMNVYYASKSFVYSLAHGYHRELKDMKSKVTISVLCPGPVKTRFEEVANAKFNISSLQPEKVARIAVNKTLKGKLEIVPGFMIKCGHFFSHLFPKRFISKIMRKQSEMKE